MPLPIVEGMRARPLLLYDASCPLCTFQSKLLSWLDWGHTIRLVPYDHPEAAASSAGLTRAQLREAIHLVGTEGRIWRGARALRRVCLQMPLLFPVALFLWFPGVIQVAESAYAFVSRRRHLLGRLFGCGTACAVLPAKARGDDILG